MTETSAPGTAVNVGGANGQRPAGFMAAEAMLAYINDRLESRLVDSVVAYGQLTLVIAPEAWVDAARLCREDPALAMNFWEFLDAVDRADGGFDVVAHVYSTEHHHDVTLRVNVPGGREKPVLPSLTGVWRGANWSERETFDMFGIEFEGHPGLQPRILTIENFEGWPLRKDFQLTSRNAKPWPGAKEPGEPGESGDAPAAGGPAAAAGPEDKAAAAKAKAERAKAKAAEMRAKKAAERAAASGEAPAASTEEQAEASDAQRTTDAEASAAAQAEPSSDLIADSVDEFVGGDTEDEAAAAAATAGGDPTASTPEGAAEVAGSDIAKDAAAGAPQGDTAQGAPQDAAGEDEPVINAEGEAAAAEGAPPTASGTPGVEAEGRHGGAEVQSGARDSADTPGMTPETQDADASPQAEDDVPVVPAPGSAAAPLDTDAPPEAAQDERHGLERETLGVDDDPGPDEDAGGATSAQVAEGGSGPTQQRVEEGPSPHPGASERTDAADRADPDRELASDQTVEDEGEDR